MTTVRLSELERELVATEPALAWSRAKWRCHREDCKQCAFKICDVGRRLHSEYLKIFNSGRVVSP